MNLAKIVIIPLGFTIVPPWIHNIGCKINAPGEIQRYLGAPIGFQLKPFEMHDFFLDKISKTISGWSYHLLSFIGKVILIQHVLQSITIYHMMYMAAPTKIADQINRLFKDFLWGFDTKTRQQKNPLVAWIRLTQQREDGGLGFKDYTTHAEALLNRWMPKGLEDTITKWFVSFLSLIKDFTWEQRRA